MKPARLWKTIRIVLFDRDAEKHLETNKKLRKDTVEKINKMRADLNGCSDKWFLSVKNPLDECIPKDNGA